MKALKYLAVLPLALAFATPVMASISCPTPAQINYTAPLGATGAFLWSITPQPFNGEMVLGAGLSNTPNNSSLLGGIPFVAPNGNPGLVCLYVPLTGHTVTAAESAKLRESIAQLPANVRIAAQYLTSENAGFLVVNVAPSSN